MMNGRDPGEPHRASTNLELLFDLVFVVAIANAVAGLHHSENVGHFGEGLFSYLMAFFGIWWAWMNFSWFASCYDVDDWLYRILTFLQMAGALVLAAGIPDLMDTEHRSFTLALIGYFVMRVAMVTQWLRASVEDPSRRRTCLRYASGIAAIQVLWLGIIWVPPGLVVPAFAVGVVGELAVPAWAARAGQTPWHPHHITERYGLLTIIVCGETVLASAGAVIQAAHEREALGDLILVAATAFVMVVCLWWIYFVRPQHELIRDRTGAFRWGYVHYVVFAAIAAVGGGFQVAVEYQTHTTDIAGVAAALTVCLPVGVYLLAVWFIIVRPQCHGPARTVVPIVAAAIVLAAWLPFSMQIAAALLVLLVVALEKVAGEADAAAETATAGPTTPGRAAPRHRGP